MTINYLTGDVTKSKVEGLKILPHIVNTQGFWNSGVVVPIGKKWPHVKKEYKEFHSTTHYVCPFNETDVWWELGEVQFVKGDEDFVIGNMIGQKFNGTEKINGKDYPPIRYEALQECMDRVADLARQLKASIVAPKFGSLRAGGSWDVIEKMIEASWKDIDVYVYEFVEGTK